MQSDSACQDLFGDNNQLPVHYLVTNDCAPAMASYHSLWCRLFVMWNEFLYLCIIMPQTVGNGCVT